MGTNSALLTRIRDFFKSIYQMRQVVDATRVEDGQIVAIKEVRRITKGREREIMHTLTTDPLHLDPKNHCAPLLDYFSDERESEHEFIVMPLYRKFDDPPFYAVGEVIDFVQQTLEVRSEISYVQALSHKLRDYNTCTTITLLIGKEMLAHIRIAYGLLVIPHPPI